MDIPSFVVNVIAESRGINYRQRNANTFLLEFYNVSLGQLSFRAGTRGDIPTVMGLIWIPGSRCAVFGSTGAA